MKGGKRTGVAMAAGMALWFATAAQAAAPSARVQLHLFTWLNQDQRVALGLRQGEESLCRVTTAYEKKHFEQAACAFAVDPHGGELVVEGTIEGTHWEDERPGRQRGERRYRLLDFNQVGAPLLRADGDYGEHFADYATRLQAFVKREYDEDSWLGEMIEAGTPATQAQLDAARERLGFELPPDYVALLRKLGGVSVSDHGFTDADELQDGYTAMVKDWGTPEDVLREGDPGTQELLRRSTLLFTEVGDGLGGLLYHPAVKACGDAGGLYWIHQENGHGPMLLRDDQGACASFAEAVWWLFEGYVQDQLVDDFEQPTLLLDSGLPGQGLTLDVDPFGESGFGVSAYVSWAGARGTRSSGDWATPSLGR